LKFLLFILIFYLFLKILDSIAIIKYNLYIILCSGKIMEFFNGIIGTIIGPDEETDDDDTDSAEESSEEVSAEESSEEEGSSSDEEEEVSFSKGDEVKILTGKHKNKVGTIKQFTKDAKKAKVMLNKTGKNTTWINIDDLQLVDSSSEVSAEEEEDEDEDEEENERNTNDSDDTSKVSEESSSSSEYYSSSEEDEEEGGEEKKSEESKSYEKMKEKIDKNGIYIKTKRSVKLPDKYNGTEPRIPNRDAHLIITEEERVNWYNMLNEEFKLKDKFKLNIESPFKTVDQTGTNACSFLGFSLLCWLKNKDVFQSIYGEKTWKELEDKKLVKGKRIKEWEAKWEDVKKNRPKGSDKGGGMNNIGQMLDTVLDTYKFNTTNLVYIPIRGTNDNNYNPDVVKKGTEYPKHLDEIQKYIEKIIDTKEYLIMNTDQHTRVYFRYNKTHLLAFDNYPINKKQIRCKNVDKNVYTILDETKGGISKVNKFFVYRNVRDLAYFN
jgi:ribosomal protein L24